MATLQFVFLLFALIALPNQYFSMKILDKMTFKPGESVTLTCDADTLDIDSNITTGFHDIEVAKYVNNAPRVFALFKNKTATEITSYYNGSSHWMHTLPDKDAVMAGNYQYERSLMKIKIIMTKTVAADAAPYECLMRNNGKTHRHKEMLSVSSAKPTSSAAEMNMHMYMDNNATADGMGNATGNATRKAAGNDNSRVVVNKNLLFFVAGVCIMLLNIN